MYDYRTNSFNVNNAFLFSVTYSDGFTVEFQVNPEFSSVTLSQEQVEIYAPAIGRIPKALRTGLQTVWIHKGSHTFGGGNNNFLIHTGDIGQAYISNGFLEEAFIHEGVHTSIDPIHANSSQWRNAQNSDPEFISTYARDNANTEDLAESYLAYLAIKYRAHRIPQSMIDIIEQTIPNRISYFDKLNLNLSILEDKAKETDQSWLVGTGDFSDNTLTIEALITKGGVFGEDFNPDSIETNVWGQITITFTSCKSAQLSYNYINNKQEMVSGGYTLVRLGTNIGVQNCLVLGFDQMNNHNWTAGTWYGGASRSGEGILLDALENDQAIFTWFTYGNNDR